MLRFARSARLSSAFLLLASLTFLTACGADLGTPPIGKSDTAMTNDATASTTDADAAPAEDSDVVGEVEEIADGAAPEADAGSTTDEKALSLILTPPSINFDLTHWYLTLPSSAQIMPIELNSGYQYADTFFTDTRTGGMSFRCPNIAGTTANSTHSRTELREMLNPTLSTLSDLSNNWTIAQGGTMNAAVRIDHTSTTGTTNVGNVVIGQIHGPHTEAMRLHFVKGPNDTTGRIFVAMENVLGKGVHSPDLVSNATGDGIKLGERFTYQIRLYGTTLTVYIGRVNRPTVKYTATIDPGYAGLGLYFKAGVYNQDNTGDPADYVQATFFKLTHTHP